VEELPVGVVNSLLLEDVGMGMLGVIPSDPGLTPGRTPTSRWLTSLGRKGLESTAIVLFSNEREYKDEF
jgi:hypothetical protein